jgi:hypothetical protein
VTDRLVIRNEFAMVEVLKDDSAHDPRLLIRDMQTGATVHLDALELEALTRVRHGDLRPLLDPSQTLSVRDDDDR